MFLSTIMLSFFFFFSSRRRHTRYWRDWSSDVCSSDLIRPIYHQLEHRADAHVLIAFLAYCLQVTLKNRLMIHAPGLTPAAVLEKLATIQMVEVWIPMTDGRWLVLPRHTQPQKDVQAMLEKIQIALPTQPPP